MATERNEVIEEGGLLTRRFSSAFLWLADPAAAKSYQPMPYLTNTPQSSDLTREEDDVSIFANAKPLLFRRNEVCQL